MIRALLMAGRPHTKIKMFFCLHNLVLTAFPRIKAHFPVPAITGLRAGNNNLTLYDQTRQAQNHPDKPFPSGMKAWFF